MKHRIGITSANFVVVVPRYVSVGSLIRPVQDAVAANPAWMKSHLRESAALRALRKDGHAERVLRNMRKLEDGEEEASRLLQQIALQDHVGFLGHFSLLRWISSQLIELEL